MCLSSSPSYHLHCTHFLVETIQRSYMYKSYKPHCVQNVCVCGGGGGVMTGACWASTSPDALVELCIRPNGRGWSVLCA